jgi:glycosyltransferase involved in cell wall biosynthesis
VATIAIISFRLGGTDGVAIEASKWAGALVSLGHEVITVAGEGSPDRIVSGLAIGDPEGPSFAEVRSAIADADVVIVENLVSLPLNLAARNVVYDALEGRRAIFRHHDLAWQRAHLAHHDPPRTAEHWWHVTINELSRRELAARGIEAVTIMNSFDCEPPLGDRARLRGVLDVVDETLVVLPTRALARKNVEGALELCEAIGATFWLLGPAEDGYGPTLERLIDASSLDVRRGVPISFDMHDAYAASDLVVMPSLWEGFGNPVLESVTHRRPLALNPYPVAREIISFGFDFFELDDVVRLEGFLASPDEERLEHNLAVARQHFNLRTLPERLARLLSPAGIE